MSLSWCKFLLEYAKNKKIEPFELWSCSKVHVLYLSKAQKITFFLNCIHCIQVTEQKIWQLMTKTCSYAPTAFQLNRFETSSANLMSVESVPRYNALPYTIRTHNYSNNYSIQNQKSLFSDIFFILCRSTVHDFMLSENWFLHFEFWTSISSYNFKLGSSDWS